ncbi:hypothetical protein [Mesorhizobium sp. WSM3860]|uniref:hypothetical protein n=1 Tax=Mesorhizobium sp. WSM3860 TaxID=2029403 RepID=UPI000BAF78EE|nr:hypothetical protein [Mesorhizobium sp. WSM3860]PBC01790.1 hypothetical protein CK220_24470 [Mesorhizobium sp. WSM3860]
MSSVPAIVVGGLGRCGTSLMMQMLYAGGVSCVGEWPAFEGSASMFGSFDPNAFAALRGQAIKLIAPAEHPIFDMPKHIVIWLDREPHEQAKSQLKMVSAMFGSVATNRRSIRSMVAGIRSERPSNMAAVGAKSRCPTLLMSFERLLTQPTVATDAIAAFLQSHGYKELNVSAMRRQIRRRYPTCYPGMMEIELLETPAPIGLARPSPGRPEAT